MKSVYFLLFDNFHLLDFSGALQVYETANKLIGSEYFKISVIANSKKEVNTHFGLSLSVKNLPKTVLDNSILIVCGGVGVHQACNDNELREWYLSHRSCFSDIVSICSGAFLLANWGVLNGKNAVTHWIVCDKLKNDYPLINVLEDSIFVKHDNIWTSAGVTAGIDLNLALIEKEVSHDLSLSIAKDLVVYLRRDGDQSQFSELLKIQCSNKKIAKIVEWIKKNCRKDIMIADIASKANMSERNIIRLFKENTGLPPLKFITKMRLEKAKTLLENSDKALISIALECGFKNELNLRRAFKNMYNISPVTYRKRFL